MLHVPARTLSILSQCGRRVHSDRLCGASPDGQVRFRVPHVSEPRQTETCFEKFALNFSLEIQCAVRSEGLIEELKMGCYRNCKLFIARGYESHLSAVITPSLDVSDNSLIERQQGDID